ncbi:rRNA biogenesis protein rrp36 [Coemansia sp. RSA 1722]|nr:rRNA biogenesis protein rrp36 [Coemansia sp. RSA 486]KAJ2599470.1 rRNA biogenesis protein rrp36 [Coemansia sp. RSA 1722]KAJ2602385.1 rRNA biogenesis protein rrp36 [Coemansia sp. RSA 1721]KAJ2637189.1 rRNA biogenesis protein rrp36 [Coemansia sp. RSA 1286]
MPKRATKPIEQYSSSEDESSDASSVIGSEDEFSHDESGSESADEHSTVSKADRIREQLADVPFDQLVRIQKQIGVEKQGTMSKNGSTTRDKVRRALLSQKMGVAAPDTDSGEPGGSDNNESNDSDNSAPETVATGQRALPDLHRNSKKMPSMMSSKRPVSRFRQVVGTEKPQTRDPRFDSLSGHFNEDLFEKTYAFLDTQRQQEVEEMRSQVKRLQKQNPQEAERIQLAIDSVQSQMAAKSQKKRMQELKRRHRVTEAEQVKQGKQPYFLKKKDLKSLEVAQKFSQLKDSSKLDGFLEKRRKRNATKDHRNMPYQRREQ